MKRRICCWMAIWLVGLTLTGAPLAAHRADAPLCVLIFLETECPICQKTLPRLQALARQYAGRVRFEAVYPTETVSRREVQDFEKRFALPFPHRLDPRHRLVDRYGVTTTPEVVLLSATGQVRYQGSVDDQFYRLGRARPAPTAFYLRDAIEATLSNRPVGTTRTTPVGCLIN
jgi:thiol-disulfide isomerase/thioredoxin